MLGPVSAHRGSAVLGEGQVLPSRGGCSPPLWGVSTHQGQGFLGESGLAHAHPTLAPVCVPGPCRRKSWWSCWPSTATCSSVPRPGARPSRSCCPAVSPPSCTGPRPQRSGPAWLPPPMPRSASPEPVYSGYAALFGGGGPLGI